MRIKIIELFAGIGSPRKALNNLNIPHEVVAFSEIDKYAVEAYRAIHDDYETQNLGDIKEISYLPDCDLLTYGFPCQDISIAGCINITILECKFFCFKNFYYIIIWY